MGQHINVRQDTIKVRVYGTKVVIEKNGLLAGELEWKAARELGQALVAKAAEAERLHWQQCEKRLGKPMPVKWVMGLPVLEDELELERLG